jgi:hypothetical protein
VERAAALRRGRWGCREGRRRCGEGRQLIVVVLVLGFPLSPSFISGGGRHGSNEVFHRPSI